MKKSEMVAEYVSEYKVHIERDAYSGAHFDSTVVPLADGLVLLMVTESVLTIIQKYFRNGIKSFTDF